MKIIQDMFDTKILHMDVFKMTLDDSSEETQIIQSVSRVTRGMICAFTPFLLRNIQLLERLEFHLISIRNTYVLTHTHVVKKLVTPSTFSIEKHSAKDALTEDDIKSLATPIYLFSRYYADGKIPKEKSADVYYQWVRNSLYGGYADASFLARVGKTIVGLCTVKIKNTVGYIDLLGVLPAHQDKKIGKYLIANAVEYLTTRNISDIRVVTEGENVKANIFYQKNNFVLLSVDLVYHKHL